MTELSDALDGIAAKLDRARALRAEVADLMNGVLSTVDTSDYLQSHLDEASESLIITAAGDDPTPIQLSVRVGEVVHQLRTVLDHAVNAMALAQGERPNTARQFPAARNAKEFEEGAGTRWLAGLSQRAIEEIERLQPYNHESPSLLQVLSDLDNRDKHRMLVVAAMAAVGNEIEVDGELRQETTIILPEQPSPLERLSPEGSELARFRIVPFDPELEFRVGGKLVFLIEDPGSGTLHALDVVLDWLLKEVSGLIDDFAPLFVPA